MHDESHRCDRRLGCHTGDEPDQLDRPVHSSPHPFLCWPRERAAIPSTAKSALTAHSGHYLAADATLTVCPDGTRAHAP
jgi:hypothetical protein